MVLLHDLIKMFFWCFQKYQAPRNKTVEEANKKVRFLFDMLMIGKLKK